MLKKQDYMLTMINQVEKMSDVLTGFVVVTGYRK